MEYRVISYLPDVDKKAARLDRKQALVSQPHVQLLDGDALIQFAISYMKVRLEFLTRKVCYTNVGYVIFSMR